MSSAPAPTRPVIRYHGGKWRLAPWIISHFPPHRVYVEPFGGAASVLLRKPRSKGEVYNDLWGRVVDVFRVLRDPALAAELARRLALTPFARAEFESCTPEAFDTTDVVERARLTIARSYMGHGSNSPNELMSTGFRSNSMRSNTTPAAEWANYPSCIREFTARMRGVIIESRAAGDVMTGFDGPDTLHYVDPPYVAETRSPGNPYCKKHMYAHEMTDADHESLALVLRGLTGMVAVSGYRCDLYDALFAGWRRVETMAIADGGRPRTEALWLNDAAVAAAVQPCMFADAREERSREERPGRDTRSAARQCRAAGARPRA